MEEDYVEEEDEYLQGVNVQQIEEQRAHYEEQLQTIKSQLSALLLDFRKYHVFYMKNRGNQEYQRAYENVKANMTKLGAQLFQLNNEIEGNINAMNESLMALDESIAAEKEENDTLKRKIQQVYANHNAAAERIDDYEKVYDQGYLRNWGLLLSIGAAMYASTLFFKRPTASV